MSSSSFISKRNVLIVSALLAFALIFAISSSLNSPNSSPSPSSSQIAISDDEKITSSSSSSSTNNYKKKTEEQHKDVSNKPGDEEDNNSKDNSIEDQQQNSNLSNQHKQQYFKDVPQCAIEIFEDAKQKGKLLTDRNNLNPASSVHPFIGETFMIHYSPSTKRRRVMTEILKKHKVDVTRWILEFDRENITESMKKCLHDSFDPKLYRNKKKAKRPKPMSPLLPIQSSVVTKHYFALYLAATSTKKGNYFMILEDDVFLRNGFGKHFETLLGELKNRHLVAKHENNNNNNVVDSVSSDPTSSTLFDVMMIGGCLKMHANRKKGKGIKFPAPRVSPHLFWRNEARCAHAYIVSKEGARKILNSLPMTHPIDFQLNAAFQEEGEDFEKHRSSGDTAPASNNNNNNKQQSVMKKTTNNNNNDNKKKDLKVLWAEPWLAVQGDIDGGCVTAKFYGKCPSIELNPGPEFDAKMIGKSEGF